MIPQAHSWAYIQTKLYSKRYTHPNVHITVAVFTTAKTWKKPKCPLTDEWIKKI